MYSMLLALLRTQAADWVCVGDPLAPARIRVPQVGGAGQANASIDVLREAVSKIEKMICRIEKGRKTYKSLLAKYKSRERDLQSQREEDEEYLREIVADDEADQRERLEAAKAEELRREELKRRIEANRLAALALRKRKANEAAAKAAAAMSLPTQQVKVKVEGEGEGRLKKKAKASKPPLVMSAKVDMNAKPAPDEEEEWEFYRTLRGVWSHGSFDENSNSSWAS